MVVAKDVEGSFAAAVEIEPARDPDGGALRRAAHGAPARDGRPRESDRPSDRRKTPARALAPPPSELRADTSQGYRQIDRLGDVVGGALIERFDNALAV